MRVWPLWLALAACWAPAAAQTSHDTKLERAAMEIVARSIGDIRTTSAPDNLAEMLATRASDAVRPPTLDRDRGWTIVESVEATGSTSEGSFQNFGGEGRRRGTVADLPPKTVSRIIGF